MMRKEVAMPNKELNKKLILKVLTDPSFRNLLKSSPAKALGLKKVTEKNKVEISKILELVDRIEADIGSIADEVLCGSGGGLC